MKIILNNRILKYIDHKTVEILHIRTLDQNHENNNQSQNEKTSSISEKSEQVAEANRN